MSGSHERHTILIVEDDHSLRELLATFLEAAGYSVIQARDGEEAVAMFNVHRASIALVLTDMGLPKLGGWELFQQLRRIDPKAKVVMASGYMNPSIRNDMLEAGALDFIQKPYVPQHILQRIDELLHAS
jgi:DNA-binding response OmpR family regulator